MDEQTRRDWFEKARMRLGRLERLQELNAPLQVVQKERELVLQALDMVCPQL